MATAIGAEERVVSTRTSNIALVRRLFHEGSSVPNPPAIVADIFAPDFICHGPPGVNHSHDGGAMGPEACLFQDAFTDVTFRIETITADGDRVRCRFVAHGRQIAEFHGVKPSGTPLSVVGTATFRVEQGQIKEGWGVLIWN